MKKYTKKGFILHSHKKEYQSKIKKSITIITKALNDYLAKCIQNNHHCAHCSYNHDGICFFAKECFENDQKYYNDEDDE